MHLMDRRTLRFLWGIIGCVILVLSCSLFEGGDGEPGPGENQPDQIPTATPTPVLQGEAEPEPDPPPIPDACPDGPASFGLRADHNFWTPTGMGDWVWQASGLLSVHLDDNGQVTNTSSQIIPGSQSGAFSEGTTSCSFEAPAEVIITLAGSCEESVLTLEIWEDWQMGTYDWVCDDNSFSFELPNMGMPPAQHKAAFNFGTGGTYSFEIPFGGGNGTKTFTLLP